MKPRVVTIKVQLYVTPPSGTPTDHPLIMAKRCIAAALENRGTVFEDQLPKDWEITVKGIVR